MFAAQDLTPAAATLKGLTGLILSRRRAEHELLILAACPSVNQPLREAIGRLVASAIDWDYISLQAARHGVSSLVYSNLCMAGVEFDAPQFSQLAQDARASANRSLYLMGELVKVLQGFARMQVDVIPFKGPVLSVIAFGDVSSRQFSDLDLFIRERDLQRACDLLLEHGFRCTHHPDWVRPYSRFGHELGFFRAEGDYEVDLQWRFAKKWLSFPIEPASVWSRSRLSSVAGYEMRQPCLEDSLLILCGHGYRHCWSHLKWIADIAGFTNTFGRRLDWDEVIQQASQSGALRVLRLGVWLALQLRATSVPGSVADDVLMDKHVAALGEQVMQRLFDGSASLTPDRRLSLLARVGFHLRARERLREKLPALIPLADHFGYIARRYMRHYMRSALQRHRSMQ